MKKIFWVTFSLFIVSIIIFILKWDVIQESSSSFEFVFFFFFILLALLINFPFIGVIIIPIMILVIWLLARNIDSDILKTIALAFFMFYTALQLIFAVSLLGDQTKKETIIETFGSKENMLETVKERIVSENPHIEFYLIKQEFIDGYNDGESDLPYLSYVFDVAYTDEDGTIYKGSLETDVSCSGGVVDDCHVKKDEFKNLKTAEGKVFEIDEETEAEYYDRISADDYELNWWEMNPYY